MRHVANTASQLDLQSVTDYAFRPLNRTGNPQISFIAQAESRHQANYCVGMESGKRHETLFLSAGRMDHRTCHGTVARRRCHGQCAGAPRTRRQATGPGQGTRRESAGPPAGRCTPEPGASAGAGTPERAITAARAAGPTPAGSGTPTSPAARRGEGRRNANRRHSDSRHNRHSVATTTSAMRASRPRPDRTHSVSRPTALARPNKTTRPSASAWRSNSARAATRPRNARPNCKRARNGQRRQPGGTACRAESSRATATSGTRAASPRPAAWARRWPPAAAAR